MVAKKYIMDYGKFINKISARRKQNLIRDITEVFMKNREGLFFAGGMPNAQLFPFKEITVTYSDGTHKKLVDADLFSALQYGGTQGYPPLIKKWQEFQEKWHSPPCPDWDVQFTAGSMEGFSKVLEMVIEEGQPLMYQVPTYTGILSALMPLKPDLIEINIDDDGALPDDIENACEARIKSGKPLPKLLYVNPTGSNPVGNVYTDERKEAIYRLARKYDFLIVEDDPYYFLHFLERQPRSFLSMDEDGRVLRLDSFSKLMSAGIRLGVVTGPKALLKRINLHVAASTLHASSLSQVLVCKLLEAWSDEELKLHIAKLQQFYREKRDIMLKAVEKHFTGIAEWSIPRGGMFVWLKVTVLEDVYDLAMNKCASRGVFVLPGHAFSVDSSKPCQYLRLCYSQAKTDEVDEGLGKIAAIIREEAAKKPRNGIAKKVLKKDSNGV